MSPDPTPPIAAADWSFHHIGVACPSIVRARAAYELLGYRFESEFTDPAQGVRGEFFVGPGPRVELLEDLPEHQTVAPWINRKMATPYHSAWLVPGLDEALARAGAAGAKPTGEPKQSVHFKGPIVFALVKGQFLIELIEAGPDFAPVLR